MKALLILVALGLLLVPLGATAQEVGKVYRIGLLSPYASAENVSWHQAFRRGLRYLGWVEGQNITIESRNANGRTERLPGLVADLVGLKVDLPHPTARGLDARRALGREDVADDRGSIEEGARSQVEDSAGG